MYAAVSNYFCCLGVITKAAKYVKWCRNSESGAGQVPRIHEEPEGEWRRVADRIGSNVQKRHKITSCLEIKLKQVLPFS